MPTRKRLHSCFITIEKIVQCPDDGPMGTWQFPGFRGYAHHHRASHQYGLLESGRHPVMDRLHHLIGRLRDDEKTGGVTIIAVNTCQKQQRIFCCTEDGLMFKGYIQESVGYEMK